jgi:photosynthetic reaction center cytochrome c subunit
MLASENHKNLKLLGGAPASSIGDTMQAFAFALGQNCQFCHVQGNFAADDKPEKETARKMLAMVMSVNKDTFGGHQVVRCFTCHQGNAHPPGPKF